MHPRTLDAWGSESGRSAAGAVDQKSFRLTTDKGAVCGMQEGVRPSRTVFVEWVRKSHVM